MAHRGKIHKATDRRVFKRTATATKTMNIAPKVRRGGIRL